jgi:hypothetical protein
MKEQFLVHGSSTRFLDRYFALIEKHSKGDRFPHSEGHHVLPKFAFGVNDHLRYVSFRVHFLLHELLWKHFKTLGLKTLANKAAYPLVRMCGKNASRQNVSGVRFSSRAFDAAKRANREAMRGAGNPMHGKKHRAESIAAMSAAKKGQPMSEDQKKKMKGRKVSDEARQNMKNAARPPATPEECAARSRRMREVWRLARTQTRSPFDAHSSCRRPLCRFDAQ